MNILLTGGAGYIGSHICNTLLDLGYKVSTIDNLSTGNKNLIPKKVQHINSDISDTKKVTTLIQNNDFDVVMHLAAFTRVGESVKNPEMYFKNNFDKAKIFIDTCLDNNLKKFIFSSTGSVYGNLDNNINIKETEVTNPINPYSESKLRFEKYLINETLKKKAFCTILRYFNVAGADLKKRSGLISNPDNLIKAICEVAVKKRENLIINGNDYKTKDGTPIRDFIHVLDLVDIHIIVAKSLIESGENEIYNCGYGKGFSIMDVVQEMGSIIGYELPVKFGERRKGDAVYSVADNEKFLKKFTWKPKYNNLKIILESALEWEKSLNKK
jgi:UDP-glucose 4-epimerase